MRKLFLLLCGVVFSVAFAQAQRTITGKVTDEKGTPLSNASVTVKGTTKGTVTKADGTYSVSVPANARVLVFSAVDMSAIEITIGSSTVVDASLKGAEKALSEVVVTAFGIKKDKKTLGYSTTQLSGADLEAAHTTNVTNALAAKIPGVRIAGTGGDFSSSAIFIRGFTTFSGSNQPLFVIDGIPIDNSGGGDALQNGVTRSSRAIDLNQEDIENINVLKGAAAAVLYGSRASNGVIIITTKKGKLNQKGTIEYSTNYQIETVNRLPTYQNQYAEGNNGVFSPTAQTSWGPLITGQTVTNAYNWLTNTNTRTEVLAAYPNNVSDIFRHGNNWQQNLAFTSGSDKTSFRFSYGYLKNNGVLDNNTLTRHNFSLNASSKINNYLTITASGNYSNNTSKRTQQGNQLSNPLFRGWFTPRSYNLSGIPFSDAAGNETYPLGEDNPYWTIVNNRFNDETNRFIGNIALNFKLTKWLTADYKLGSDVYSFFSHAYDQIGARGGANTTANGIGGVREVRNNYRNINSNGFFTAQKRIKNWSGAAIVGTEFQQIYSNVAQLDGKGVIVRDFEQLANTTTYTPSPSNGSTTFRLLGLYGDFSASYKSIITGNVSLRNDWSSTFKIGNNSYLYTGYSLNVNFTEMFPKLKSKIIDLIKVRGNIAKVGKAGTDFIYQTDSYYAGAGSADGFGPTINFPFNGIQGYTLSNTAGNPGLGPEFTNNREVGADLGFIKGRITIEVTKYRQHSTNLIFGVPVSAASGITTFVKNAGNLTNRGVELGVNIVPIKTKNFNWNVNVTYTQFKAIVDALAPGVTNIFLGGFVTPNVRLVAGDEYGQIYGNAFVRDSTKGNKIVVGANGLPFVTSGVVKIGNPNPKYTMGFTNTLNWKGFTFSFLMELKEGGQQYSRNVADLFRNGVAIETAQYPRYNSAGVLQKPYLFDAVYANGQPDTTHLSAQDYFGNSGIYTAAEGFIRKTSWFRIREASVSYSLPPSVLSKTPFSKVTFSVFGRNLFLQAPFYPHLDPEQNVLGVSNAQGLEFNALPQTRNVGVGLNVQF